MSSGRWNRVVRQIAEVEAKVQAEAAGRFGICPGCGDKEEHVLCWCGICFKYCHGDYLHEALPEFSPETEMETSRKTCGPLYKEAILKYAGGDPDKEYLFAAGFVSGEAEKVYLGACPAAMFRPSSDNLWWLREVVIDVMRRYGLWHWQIGDELWIFRPDYFDQLKELEDLHEAKEVNTPRWHGLRAELCGVPEAEIDLAFHEREGYGEPCD